MASCAMVKVVAFFWGMGIIPPLIGNPYNGYIKLYYWVDDPPLLYGNNGSLDPSTVGGFNPFEKYQDSTQITTPCAGRAADDAEATSHIGSFPQGSG